MTLRKLATTTGVATVRANMKKQDGIGVCNDFVLGKLNILSERYVLMKQSQLY